MFCLKPTKVCATGAITQMKSDYVIYPCHDLPRNPVVLVGVNAFALNVVLLSGSRSYPQSLNVWSSKNPSTSPHHLDQAGAGLRRC